MSVLAVLTSNRRNQSVFCARETKYNNILWLQDYSKRIIKHEIVFGPHFLLSCPLCVRRGATLDANKADTI